LATPDEIGVIIYTVTVDDGMNTASSSVEVTVTEPDPIVCPTPKHFVGQSYYDEGEIGAWLSWDRANYESTLDKFEIYRSINNIDFEVVERIVNTPSINHYECHNQVDNPGTYYYQIVALYQNGCQSDPLQIEVEVLDYTSVSELTSKAVAIYPNPTSGKITVASENMQQISVVNTIGQTLRQINAEGTEITIDMSAFGKGIYMLMIQTDNGVTAKKVIVE
jgi:hypothetical protein